MARRTKLTDEVQRCLVEALRNGAYRETACVGAGIRPATLRAWLRRGLEETSGRYHALAEALWAAEGEFEARLVAKVESAADRDWRSGAWLLERRFPKRWGQRVQLGPEQVFNEFFDRMQQQLDRATFNRILQIAAGETGASEPGRPFLVSENVNDAA
jgi:hypothetical protein